MLYVYACILCHSFNATKNQQETSLFRCVSLYQILTRNADTMRGYAAYHIFICSNAIAPPYSYTMMIRGYAPLKVHLIYDATRLRRLHDSS